MLVDYIRNNVLCGFLTEHQLTNMKSCIGLVDNIDIFHIEVKFDSPIVDCSYLMNESLSSYQMLSTRYPVIKQLFDLYGDKIRTPWLEFDLDSTDFLNIPNIFFNPKLLTEKNVCDIGKLFDIPKINAKINNIWNNTTDLIIYSVAFFLQRKTKDVKAILGTSASAGGFGEYLNKRNQPVTKKFNDILEKYTGYEYYILFVDSSDLNVVGLEVAPRTPDELDSWLLILDDINNMYPDHTDTISLIKNSFKSDNNYKSFIHHVKFTYKYDRDLVTAKIYIGIDKKEHNK